MSLLGLTDSADYLDIPLSLFMTPLCTAGLPFTTGEVHLNIKHSVPNIIIHYELNEYWVWYVSHLYLT